MEFLLASAGPDVATWKTILFGLLLIGLVLCLAFEEKIHAKKSVIAGTFAIVCLFLGAVFNVLPFEDIVVGSHEAIDIVASEHQEEHAIGPCIKRRRNMTEAEAQQELDHFLEYRHQIQQRVDDKSSLASKDDWQIYQALATPNPTLQEFMDANPNVRQ